MKSDGCGYVGVLPKMDAGSGACGVVDYNNFKLSLAEPESPKTCDLDEFAEKGFGF